MAINTHHLRKKGYTIVEVILVISLVGLLMPAIFSILYVIIQQQLKIYEITEVKRQGDYIMQVMKEKITRDAEVLQRDDDGVFNGTAVITNICNTVGSTYTSSNQGLDFVFRDGNLNRFQYVLSGNTIFFRHVGSSNIDAALNNSAVSITNLQMSCSLKSSLTNPIVTLSYTATYNRPVPNPQLGTTVLDYQTKVKLRLGSSN